jgi:hypothetical protein
VGSVTDTSEVHAVCRIGTKLNSMACDRERTIPTERPPLVGEISANFLADRGWVSRIIANYVYIYIYIYTYTSI